MTVRPLRLIGDPVLRTPSDPVTRFDRALARLVDDLMDTVLEPGRAGLAACQIGSSLAVFSYNLDGQHGYVINPTVVSTDGDQDGPEGCLSVPGVWAERHRAAATTVEGVNLREEKVVVAGTGEMARCLQHETDHLRGELYIDGLESAERRRVLRQLHHDQIAGPPPDGPAVL
jgi:peptide deformylase